MNKIIEYFKASIEEMKKVTWPTKNETYNYTLLVIGISLGVSAFLWSCDKLFEFGMQYIINNQNLL